MPENFNAVPVIGKSFIANINQAVKHIDDIIASNTYLGDKYVREVLQALQGVDLNKMISDLAKGSHQSSRQLTIDLATNSNVKKTTETVDKETITEKDENGKETKTEVALQDAVTKPKRVPEYDWVQVVLVDGRSKVFNWNKFTLNSELLANMKADIQFREFVGMDLDATDNNVGVTVISGVSKKGEPQVTSYVRITDEIGFYSPIHSIILHVHSDTQALAYESTWTVVWADTTSALEVVASKIPQAEELRLNLPTIGAVQQKLIQLLLLHDNLNGLTNLDTPISDVMKDLNNQISEFKNAIEKENNEVNAARKAMSAITQKQINNAVQMQVEKGYENLGEAKLVNVTEEDEKGLKVTTTYIANKDGTIRKDADGKDRIYDNKNHPLTTTNRPVADSVANLKEFVPDVLIRDWKDKTDEEIATEITAIWKNYIDVLSNKIVGIEQTISEKIAQELSKDKRKLSVYNFINSTLFAYMNNNWDAIASAAFNATTAVNYANKAESEYNKTKAALIPATEDVTGLVAIANKDEFDSSSQFGTYYSDTFHANRSDKPLVANAIHVADHLYQLYKKGDETQYGRVKRIPLSRLLDENIDNTDSLYVHPSDMKTYFEESIINNIQAGMMFEGEFISPDEGANKYALFDRIIKIQNDISNDIWVHEIFGTLTFTAGQTLTITFPKEAQLINAEFPVAGSTTPLQKTYLNLAGSVVKPSDESPNQDTSAEVMIDNSSTSKIEAGAKFVKVGLRKDNAWVAGTANILLLAMCNGGSYPTVPKWELDNIYIKTDSSSSVTIYEKTA